MHQDPNPTLQPDSNPGVSARFASEILAIRQQLQAAIVRCDRLLADCPASASSEDYRTLQLRYRVSPGGPLSPEGVAEIRRRFEAGETDSVIAREMGISVQGVAKRRGDFKAMTGGARRRLGALRGRIHMAPDFDEVRPEERGALDTPEE